MAESYKLCVDKKGRKESGLYENSVGQKYLRIREGTRNTYISLKTKSLTEAIKFRDARRTAKVAAKLGIGVAPDEAAKQANVTIPAVIKRYQKDGYPNKKGIPRRTGKHQLAEERYCKTLLSYFKGEKSAAMLTQKDLDDYHDWRVAQVAAGPRKGDGGHRITDLELNTLNNAFRWTVRKGDLRSNPILIRPHYHTVSDATHCREYAVSSVDELHNAAGALMSSRRSESLGWQLLIEALTGLRSEEAVALRTEAGQGEPGFVEGRSLCVRRAEKASNANPYVEVHEGLKTALAAHKIWHEARYPLSPWYFPGRDRVAGKPIDKSVLTKALHRLFKTKKLKKKFTSHGARAFYVLARRSQGISDTQIAAEINHTGGVGTIESVYGLCPPHWKDGTASPLAWTPKGQPAWSNIKKVDFSGLTDAPAAAVPVVAPAPSFEI